MRRLYLLLPSVLVLALAACGGPPIAPPDQSLHVGFPRGGVADVIRIDARDPLPLRTAELVAPDGTATPANSLNVVQNPEILGGPGAIANPWRSSMFEANNVALPNGVPDAAFRSQTQVLTILSTAEIALPDPVAYRRDWLRFRIRLGFQRSAAQIESRVVPAPEPPALTRGP